MKKGCIGVSLQINDQFDLIRGVKEAMESDVTATGGVEAEETSPDMLKNTPLNIMRLASEIEQCEGRQKYLAHTSSPSDGGDVRWYFCKVPLAANGR